jgi:hypothetical protein
MALVDGRIGAQEIEIALSLNVPNTNPLSAVQHNRKRAVIVRPVSVFQGHQIDGIHLQHATRMGYALQYAPVFTSKPVHDSRVFLPILSLLVFSSPGRSAAFCGKTGRLRW